ncbi:PE domain-containing protein [Lentzea sp. NPDC004789]
MSGTKVDLDTLRAAIKEYESIRDEVKKAQAAGDALVKVQAAGKDVPSQVYAQAAVTAGRMHLQSNQQLVDALTTRIDNLNATLRQYEQTEEGNQANLKPKD